MTRNLSEEIKANWGEFSLDCVLVGACSLKVNYD